jgi:hypothetical protein
VAEDVVASPGKSTTNDVASKAPASDGGKAKPWPRPCTITLFEALLLRSLASGQDVSGNP